MSAELKCVVIVCMMDFGCSGTYDDDLPICTR